MRLKIHCRMIRKYIPSMIFLSFLILFISTHYQHFKPKITSMREVLQIWSKNDTSTNTLFRLEKGGELKLLSECSLNNHLHMKLFKKKEETQKMATSKLRSCGNVSFSKTVLPVTALVSYPGSGNTWLRHLIQEVTGIVTGAIYQEDHMIKHGFPGGTHVDGHVIVVKTHSVDIKHALKYMHHIHRAIILIRSPFQAIVAEYTRQNCHGPKAIGTLSSTAFNTSRWTRFLEQNGMIWYRTYSNWANFEGPSLLVDYHDLRCNLPETMRRIVTFLGVKVTKDRFQCMLENQEGKFHRKVPKSQFVYFNEVVAYQLDQKISLVEKKLESRFFS